MSAEYGGCTVYPLYPHLLRGWSDIFGSDQASVTDHVITDFRSSSLSPLCPLLLTHFWETLELYKGMQVVHRFSSFGFETKQENLSKTRYKM